MTSLRARQLLAASLVLTAFIALCGAGLEQAFNSSALQAEEDKLQGLAYALLGAAEANANGELTVPETRLPDPRLANPQSGLQAAIVNEHGGLIWGSPSLADDWPLSLAPQEVGTWRFQEQGDWFSLTFGLRWLDRADAPRRYTLLIIENNESFKTQLRTYRRTLWGWLGGAALALLAVQLLILRWSLAPLRKLAKELHSIETDQQGSIELTYPSELTPLTDALNSMIQAERNQQTRYRNALGDLAHSLKTPLAVLHGVTDEDVGDDALKTKLREPLSRIQEITDYQLRKAATAGRRTLSGPIAMRPLAEKISGALQKVYADKGVSITVDIAPTLRIRADQGDLYELLGNLLDNAAKWCKQQVKVSANLSGRSVELIIDDDGPGFPEHAGNLLERGVRADNQVPGHGIGLAAVNDLIGVYDGKIELQRSPLGGGRVHIRFQA
jgi:two-component system sensor histidine kinase PhoQ